MQVSLCDCDIIGICLTSHVSVPLSERNSRQPVVLYRHRQRNASDTETNCASSWSDRSRSPRLRPFDSSRITSKTRKSTVRSVCSSRSAFYFACSRRTRASSRVDGTEAIAWTCGIYAVYRRDVQLRGYVFRSSALGGTASSWTSSIRLLFESLGLSRIKTLRFIVESQFDQQLQGEQFWYSTIYQGDRIARGKA